MAGFSQGLGVPLIIIWRNTLIPSRIRASTLAVLYAIVNLACAAMTLIMGPLIDSTSMQAALYLGAILAAAPIPFYFISHRKSLRLKDELMGDAASGQAM